MNNSISLRLVASLSSALFASALVIACSSSDDGDGKTKQPVGGGDGGKDSGGGDPKPPPTGWSSVVGDVGTFVQTFDEQNWQERTISAHNLYGVGCMGNFIGWAVGSEGGVWYTVDAGKTWIDQSSGTTSALRTVRFFDTKHGVVAGDNGALSVTEDSGQHWRLVPDTPKLTLRGAAAAKSGLFVVAGDGGTILRSLDSGATFTKSTITGAGDLRGVAGDLDGAILLAADTTGHIFLSRDNGATFALEKDVGVPLNHITVSSHGDFAMAVGPGGKAFTRTADGTWHATNTGTTADLNASLIDSGEGYLTRRYWYVAGANGTLLGSEDRGATWTKVPLRTTSNLYGLEDL